MNLKTQHTYIFSFVLHFFSGLLVSSITGLLIYFKQKPALHFSAVLISVCVLYTIAFFLGKWKLSFSWTFRIFSLLLIILIAWLGPQFIYQIRPYTFYISGLAMLVVMLGVAGALILSDEKPGRIPWAFLAFLSGFGSGYVVPHSTLQFLIFAFSIIVIAWFLFAQKINISFKIGVISSLIVAIAAFWIFSAPIKYFEQQADYEDKIVFSRQSQFHEVVITQWHHDFWFFVDKKTG